MVVGLEKKQEVTQERVESKLEQESIAEEEFDDFLSDDGTEEGQNVSYQDSDSDLDIPEDPYQVRTEKTFVNNPYNKLAIALLLVGSGVFFSMHLLRFLMGGYISLGEPESVAIPEVSDSDSSSIFDEEVKETPNEDLALHQALNQQSDEIKKVEKFNEAVKPLPEPEPEQVTTAPQPQQPTPSPTPVRTVSNTPPPRPIPVRTSRAIPRPVVEKKEPIDPMQQWLMAANIGSYQATTPQSFSSSINNNLEIPQITQVGRVREQRLNRNIPPSLYANAGTIQPTLSPQHFPRGTTVRGEISMPIIWMDDVGNYNQQRDYLIELKEGLIGATGIEIAGKGSMAVVRASEFYGDTGFLQLEVVSLIVDNSGITREYPIPPNSLIVLNKKGQILKAKAERANNVDESIAAFLLSGISRAAGVSNNPRSSSFSSFGGSIDYGDGNIVGGFIEGATEGAVQQIRQRQNQARSRFNQNATVFVIESGTDVQLLVNKPFSLE